VPAYEGFGSSYEKARSAIEAIQLHFPGRTAVIVFEPHTFSWRNAGALAWYDHVFEGAARVIILAPPGHGAEAHAQLSQDEIVARVRAAGVDAVGVRSGSEALADLDTTLKGDEVVLLLSSGPLDGLTLTVPAMLEARFA
jgi:UDP-N-acetylmuramate: L-alanyl-gamma-D-glutamyl-meso-diaminopimelate ligase